MMTTFHILAGVRTKANTSNKIFPGMSNFWNCHSGYSTQDWGQIISGALCPLCPAQFPPSPQHWQWHGAAFVPRRAGLSLRALRLSAAGTQLCSSWLGCWCPPLCADSPSEGDGEEVDSEVSDVKVLCFQKGWKEEIQQGTLENCTTKWGFLYAVYYRISMSGI